MDGPISRRGFLGVAGSSAGAAAFAGPAWKHAGRYFSPVEGNDVRPPGEWIFYNSLCRECPAGCGIQYWHRDGRITKAEGNPHAPINRGRLCARGQSAPQGQYDPARVMHPRRRTGGALAPAAMEAAIEQMGEWLHDGARLKIATRLHGEATSHLLGRVHRSFGGEAVIQESFPHTALKQACGDLFGRRVIPRYHLDRCETVVSFGAEFLETWISPVEYARQFAAMRRPEGHPRGGGRFYHTGPRRSMTATNADHHLLVPPGEERIVAWAMLQSLVERGRTKRLLAPSALEAMRSHDWLKQLPRGVHEQDIHRWADRMVDHGPAVALAGDPVSVTDEALDTARTAMLLNVACGSVGDAVDVDQPHALSAAADRERVRSFYEGLESTDILLLDGINPAYTDPELAPLIEQAGLVVLLEETSSETDAYADWVLPKASPAESWGELEVYPGQWQLQQPAMRPLWDVISLEDLLLDAARKARRPLLMSDGGDMPRDFRLWLELTWLKRLNGDEQAWHDVRRDGGRWAEPSGGSPDGSLASTAPTGDIPAPPKPPDRSADTAGAPLAVWPSILLYDGRLASRPWLQENPHPVSYVSWHSWVEIHPKHAERLGVRQFDVLRLTGRGGVSVEAPARVSEDIGEGTVGLPFGQGHTAAGEVADGRGANAWQLLIDPIRRGGLFGEVTVEPTGERRRIAITMATRDQHDRHIVQHTTVDQMEQPGRTHQGHGEHHEPIIMPLPEGYKKERDVYPPHEHKDHRWAMAVDLDACIGCQACAVACYAENNVPTVGEKNCIEGREMAWIKVVPYEMPEHPDRLNFLPMMCQHCDAAPCEPVCPVFASVHSEDGLNSQIYNRCIGTRYCSNNCPYKVRRFNWSNPEWPGPLSLQLNPEVTARSRGVMEKCTFCVQRIRVAEHQAMAHNQEVKDGDITPACAQTCPADAITFGDLLDESSRIHEIFTKHPRRYQVLQELNTKPAVAYLKTVKRET